MIKIESTIINNGNITTKLKKYPIQLENTVIQELLRIANDMRNYMIQGMKSSPPDFSKKFRRQGPKYSKSKTRKYHYPSFKGNFPRIDSGRLVGSLTVEKVPEGVEVGSLIEGKETVIYGKYLEDKDKLDRPFLKPTYEFFKPSIENRIMKAIKDTIGK